MIRACSNCGFPDELDTAEIKGIVVGTVDASIMAHIAILKKSGITVDDISNIARLVGKIAHEEIDKIEIDDATKLNTYNALFMIIFNANMKAHEKRLAEIAEQIGISPEVLQHELAITDVEAIREMLKDVKKGEADKRG